jgi:hypothetical protein
VELVGAGLRRVVERLGLGHAEPAPAEIVANAAD